MYMQHSYAQACIKFSDLNTENFSYYYTKTTKKFQNVQSSIISPKMVRKLWKFSLNEQ